MSSIIIISYTLSDSSDDTKSWKILHVTMRVCACVLPVLSSTYHILARLYRDVVIIIRWRWLLPLLFAYSDMKIDDSVLMENYVF